MAAMLLLGGSAMAQQNDSDASLIGKAQGAAADCIQPYRGSFWEISTGIEVTGICFVEGFLHRVTIYAGPNCIPNQPCSRIATRPIAYVDFDCDGNIMAVTCL